MKRIVMGVALMAILAGSAFAGLKEAQDKYAKKDFAGAQKEIENTMLGMNIDDKADAVILLANAVVSQGKLSEALVVLRGVSANDKAYASAMLNMLTWTKDIAERKTTYDTIMKSSNITAYEKFFAAQYMVNMYPLSVEYAIRGIATLSEISFTKSDGSLFIRPEVLSGASEFLTCLLMNKKNISQGEMKKVLEDLVYFLPTLSETSNILGTAKSEVEKLK